MVLSRTIATARRRLLPALLGGACALAAIPALAAKDGPRTDLPSEAKASTPGVGAYRVRAVNPDDLVLAPPRLPDLEGYTLAAVKAKIPRKGTPRVRVTRMVEETELHEFVGRGRLAEWAARQSVNPVAIFVEGGPITVPALARQLPGDSLSHDGKGTYTLRLPLVITSGATLHVDQSVKELRLSRQRGAFLVNDGRLFVTQTRITGWDEAANKPAVFRAAEEFRPFIVGWGGSKTYIADSVVSQLGYDAPKAYGIAITQYSPHNDAKLKRQPPTGWILGSEFFGNWFGFYTYEAEDVVVVGNHYHGNQVYDIDPHDRSRRLIIANNRCTGTTQKHGIILSREVNDSWIFRNEVSGSRYGGIVLDRNSVNNVVAHNESAGNQGDGITIYESANNLVWNNRVIGNQRHGIRMRNSADIRLYDNIVVGNRLAGVYGHTKDLTGTDRNLKLDPFELSFSIIVVGGQLTFNGSGPLTLDSPLSAELYNVEMLAPTKTNGIKMSGVLGPVQQDVLDILVRRRLAVIIEPADRPQRAAAARAVRTTAAPKAH